MLWLRVEREDERALRRHYEAARVEATADARAATARTPANWCRPARRGGGRG